MLRKLLITVVMAVLVSIPFALGAPSASAECVPSDADPVVCVGSMQGGGIGVEIPGLLHICLKLNALCGS